MGKPITVKDTGVCFAFPDVCNTPSPSGSTPIPYPNVGQLSDAQGESGTVFVMRKPIIHSESNIPTTIGDEAGSASPTKGKVEFATASKTVFCDDGKGVVRMFDTTTQNNGNAVGVVLGGVPTVLVGG
ncbi:DUF4150 domain-containing protein [Crocinitomicaceae bacterium]|nr:DUF4150 domain-containing protein [Crocinitomicaceae bacterium]